MNERDKVHITPHHLGTYASQNCIRKVSYGASCPPVGIHEGVAEFRCMTWPD
jgi:hypothetical protein